MLRRIKSIAASKVCHCIIMVSMNADQKAGLKIACFCKNSINNFVGGSQMMLKSAASWTSLFKRRDSLGMVSAGSGARMEYSAKGLVCFSSGPELSVIYPLLLLWIARGCKSCEEPVAQCSLSSGML